MKKILIIEDDPLLSRMFQRVFTFEGYLPCMASNGQDGLDKLTDFTPDIILLDLMMPVLNGKDMLARLKSNPATKDIPVVMLTNLADADTAKELLTEGALQYVIKNKHSPQEIADIARHILDKQKMLHRSQPSSN